MKLRSKNNLVYWIWENLVLAVTCRSPLGKKKILFSPHFPQSLKIDYLLKNNTKIFFEAAQKRLCASADTSRSSAGTRNISRRWIMVICWWEQRCWVSCVQWGIFSLLTIKKAVTLCNKQEEDCVVDFERKKVIMSRWINRKIRKERQDSIH